MTAVVTRKGVYDLSEADYHADPVPEGSLSCSGAKLLLPPSCPARFAWERKQPRSPTRAMEYGTAAHSEVLGRGWPVAVWEGKQDWRTTAARDWAEARRAEGQVPILAAEREKITEMAAVIRAHPTARLLLQAGEVLAEQSCFWQDDETEIWCRARFDAIRLPGRVIIADYKTAVSADPDEFAKAAARLRYHWQDGWYRDAVTHTLGDADPGFVFIVQEKEPPYVTGVYELDMPSQLRGRERIRSARRVYARCVASGEWPGHQPDDQTVTTISLPKWAD